MSDDKDRKAEKIEQGCTWLMVGFVVALALVVFVCIVVFAIWVNT